MTPRNIKRTPEQQAAREANIVALLKERDELKKEVARLTEEVSRFESGPCSPRMEADHGRSEGASRASAGDSRVTLNSGDTLGEIAELVGWDTLALVLLEQRNYAYTEAIALGADRSQLEDAFGALEKHCEARAAGRTAGLLTFDQYSIPEEAQIIRDALRTVPDFSLSVRAFAALGYVLGPKGGSKV